MKIGIKNNDHIVAAEWVDDEVQSHLEERRKRSRKWRIAKKRRKIKGNHR